MTANKAETPPYPPVEKDEVPNQYHPRRLPCRGGCLYASAEQWKKDGGGWSWVDYVCGPREAKNRYSSWPFARRCNLDDCPWKVAEEGYDPESARARMIELTKSHVASHTPGKSHYSNYDPASRTDCIVADLFKRRSKK